MRKKKHKFFNKMHNLIRDSLFISEKFNSEILFVKKDLNCMES